MTDEEIVLSIKSGKIGVIPTDTLYGLVGSAFSKETIERLFRIRRRNSNKKFIILISSLEDLNKFGLDLDSPLENLINNYWPGPVSIILPCEKEELSYLHLWTYKLSFRLPNNSWLRNILKQTGPLVAPTANLENFPPSKTIEEAKKYFGDSVDFYKDMGKLESKPSKLIKIENGKVEVLRE